MAASNRGFHCTPHENLTMFSIILFPPMDGQGILLAVGTGTTAETGSTSRAYHDRAYDGQLLSSLIFLRSSGMALASGNPALKAMERDIHADIDQPVMNGSRTCTMPMMMASSVCMIA